MSVATGARYCRCALTVELPEISPLLVSHIEGFLVLVENLNFQRPRYQSLTLLRHSSLFGAQILDENLHLSSLLTHSSRDIFKRDLDDLGSSTAER